jgi:hypothetical protein
LYQARKILGKWGCCGIKIAKAIGAVNEKGDEFSIVEWGVLLDEEGGVRELRAKVYHLEKYLINFNIYFLVNLQKNKIVNTILLV